VGLDKCLGLVVLLVLHHTLIPVLQARLDPLAPTIKHRVALEGFQVVVLSLLLVELQLLLLQAFLLLAPPTPVAVSDLLHLGQQDDKHFEVNEVGLNMTKL
jgi:hypothetical protein